MAVSLLLITHNDIGISLLDVATNMMGKSPIPCKSLAITSQMDIEQGYTLATQLCNEFDKSNDILIVTDIYGSTPSNIATRLLKNSSDQHSSDQQRTMITGINLPMLVKIMNYAHLGLSEMSLKACSGASDSIFIVKDSIECH